VSLDLTPGWHRGNGLGRSLATVAESVDEIRTGSSERARPCSSGKTSLLPLRQRADYSATCQWPLPNSTRRSPSIFC